MRKSIVLLSILSGTIFLANCSPKASKTVSKTPATTAAPDTKMASTTFSDAQLEQGKSIFTDNCAKCHKLIQPEVKTADQWDKILKSMIPKAKLNADDGALVKAYVMAHAKQG